MKKSPFLLQRLKLYYIHLIKGSILDRLIGIEGRKMNECYLHIWDQYSKVWEKSMNAQNPTTDETSVYYLDLCHRTEVL